MIDASQSLMPLFSWNDGIFPENAIYFQVIADVNNDFISGTYTTDTWFQYYNLSNVVLDINRITPPDLLTNNQYNFSMLAVSLDNWVNLVIENSFCCAIMKLKIFILYFLCCFVLCSFGQEKMIYDIKIRGAKKTKASFVKKVLESKSGKVLDSLALKKDIARLRRLPAISHAYFQVFHSHDNLYNVFINIEENFTIIPFANFYTTNDNEFAYRVGVNEFNFFR